MRAKFSDLTYTNSAAGKSCDAEEGAEAQPWMTPEHIAVKGTYTASDLEGMEHLNYAAGIAPFLRGPVQHDVRDAPRGRSVSTPVSRPPRSRTRFTAATSLGHRRDCP